MKELELQERSSKSLLANVLDIDDDFRHGNSAANPASGYIRYHSARRSISSARRGWRKCCDVKRSLTLIFSAGHIFLILFANKSDCFFFVFFFNSRTSVVRMLFVGNNGKSRFNLAAKKAPEKQKPTQTHIIIHCEPSNKRQRTHRKRTGGVFPNKCTLLYVIQLACSPALDVILHFWRGKSKTFDCRSITRRYTFVFAL